MLKMLWEKSHVTKTQAALKPTTTQRQNQALKFAPAKIPRPMTIGTINPATPRIGFGKPNKEACHLPNRSPHETKGLMSHASFSVGFCSDLILSTKRAVDANQPIAPKIMKIIASKNPIFIEIYILR